MKLDNIRGFSTIDEYVRHKLSEYEREEKNFEALFRYMFIETDNVMAEISDGYRIKKITYGQFRDRILSIAPTVAEALSDIPAGSLVGLYMSNSIEWIELFWAALMCGYDVLIMNTRLPDAALESSIAENNVRAVISDGKVFSVKTVISGEVAVDKGLPPISRSFGNEVIFMSSGTSENVKLCAYTGENFYHQICDSVNIIRSCPDIKRHYEGQLKQLVLLPLCHVFGFIAVYLWFAFFARTFVFPKDLNPATIQNTVKKHKVTHIFAVPMVWEAVYKAAIGKIKARSAATWRKFSVTERLTYGAGALGDAIAKRAFGEIREGLFGDSIQFLISGGSHVKPEVLRFFNAIGYHMANGYGMTEIGITSVEKSSNKKILSSGSIGAPFGQAVYKVAEDGELLVGGRTRAHRIVKAGVSTATDYDGFFKTGDIVRFVGGRYYIDGRKDDLIISESGENLNPVLAERALALPEIDRACVFSAGGVTTLLASIPGCFSEKRVTDIYSKLMGAIAAAGLDGEIRRIYFTSEPLLREGEIKPNRKRIARDFSSGAIRLIDPRSATDSINELLSELESELRLLFAEALGRENAESIGVNDSFFTDLNGTSIDYFAPRGLIKNKYGVELLAADNRKLVTVREISGYIKES